MRLGFLIAWVAAHAVYLLSPGLRRGIADNMRHVLGWDAGEAAIRRVTRGVVVNTTRNYFELARMPYTSLSDIDKMVTVHGWSHFEEARSRGKGVILATPHLGSFDVTVQVLAARSVTTSIIVEAQEPQALMDHVTSLRASKGLTFVPARPGALRTLVGCLRDGETVGIVCDRDIARDGHECLFFGEKVNMPTEPIRLAMRTGAAVIPVYSLRRGDGGYDVFVEPALPMVPKADNGLATNTQRLAEALERFIRSCPEQWVVLSPVWEDGFRQRHAGKRKPQAAVQAIPPVD
jgi:KDO2-lipid IV(A) lauroyltransferase